jgi:hypothetical protein
MEEGISGIKAGGNKPCSENVDYITRNEERK